MIAEARRVLEMEARAILDLIDRVDAAAFDAVIETILACEGRVIVMGMGKPGFIAGKMAATFASTGTPSLSVHPGDAIHGDLGMTTNKDVVILISNSGETGEVVRLLSTLKKIGVQIIAMTGNIQSTLAQHSDIVLDVSVFQEACPMGLAPTTSTTAALALGDAIAVVLIGRRNFQAKDFAFLHPGGSLGRKLLKVGEIMRTGEKNPVIHEDAPVKDALLCVTKARAGCCSVTDTAGRLVGIFTDGDLRRYLESRDAVDFSKTPIGKVMTRNPMTIDESQLAAEAFRILREKRIDELPVTNAGLEPVGLLDVQDLLNVGFV